MAKTPEYTQEVLIGPYDKRIMGEVQSRESARGIAVTLKGVNENEYRCVPGPCWAFPATAAAAKRWRYQPKAENPQATANIGALRTAVYLNESID